MHSSISSASTASPELPPRDLKRSGTSFLLWAIILGLLAWSWEGADMRPMALFENSSNMVDFASGFFPPDFMMWKMYVEEMLITIQIAVWGTALSIVCSIPFGILSSENIVPVWVYQPVRRLMDAFRAINEMVFAMLFVVAVGLGPFAGVLALWIHTTGVLAKLFSEAIEQSTRTGRRHPCNRCQWLAGSDLWRHSAGSAAWIPIHCTV